MVVNEVLEPAYSMAEASYRQIFENNYTILNFLEHLHIPPPSHFMDAARYVVNTDLKRLFVQDDLDLKELDKLIGEARKWNLTLDSEALGFKAADWVNRKVRRCSKKPFELDELEKLRAVLEHLQPLPLGLHHWKAQNIFFQLWRTHYENMLKRAESDDPKAKQWVEHFTALGELLHVRLT